MPTSLYCQRIFLQYFKKHLPCLVVRCERPLPKIKRQEPRKTRTSCGAYTDVREQLARSLTKKKHGEMPCFVFVA